MSEQSNDAAVEETEALAPQPESVELQESDISVEETEAQAPQAPSEELQASDTAAEEKEVEAPEEAPALPSLSLDELRPKMKLTGTVSRLELYGAFIDIGTEINALIHISQLGAERVNRVSDVLNVGDEVTVWVEKVDQERQQVMVTMVEPLEVDWRDLKSGQVRSGTVTRLEDFGAFINIGAEREGLVHISELSHEFVKHPSEVLNVGQEVEVKVLGFSRRKRRIDLSLKALMDAPIPEKPAPKEDVGRPPRRRQSEREEQMPAFDLDDAEDEEMPTAMEIAMRKAMGDDAPTRERSSKRKRDRRQKMRAQQEDMLSRTLQMQQDN